MPSKKFYKRSNRKGYRRKYAGKRGVKSYLRRKQKIGLALFKIRDTLSCQSSIVGEIEYRVNLTNPTDTFFTGVTAQDWTNLTGLYDQYRVFAVKLKFIPQLPNDTSTVTGFFPFYSTVDYDSTTSVSTVNEIIQYENMKIKNMYRPWKVYYRVPKVTNLASSSTIVSPGWMDMANPQTTGAIKTFGVEFDASTRYGTWIATWYLACKNRR